MTMTREEIEEKMHEAAEEIKPLVTTLVEALCEAHQKGYLAGIELGVNIGHPQWIPVEEELPKEGGHYLVSDGTDSMVDIWLYGVGWSNLDNNGRVTHWMPLPQPPRKEE